MIKGRRAAFKRERTRRDLGSRDSGMLTADHGLDVVKYNQPPTEERILVVVLLRDLNTRGLTENEWAELAVLAAERGGLPPMQLDLLREWMQ